MCGHVHSHSYVTESGYNAVLEYCFLNAAVVVVVRFLLVELPEDYRGRWETFVDQTLSETNRKNTIDLVKHTQTHAHLKYVIAVWNYTHSNFKCGICGVSFTVQIGTGNPRPSSEDDMESPFPKELTLQQVPRQT